MNTRGEFRTKNESFGVLVKHSKLEAEVVLVVNGQISSAFKHTEDYDYSFMNNKAKKVYEIIKTGIAGCKAKNGKSLPFELGTSVMHEFIKTKTEYVIELFNGELVGCEINTIDGDVLKLDYAKENMIQHREIQDSNKCDLIFKN